MTICLRAYWQIHTTFIYWSDDIPECIQWTCCPNRNTVCRWYSFILFSLLPSVSLFHRVFCWLLIYVVCGLFFFSLCFPSRSRERLFLFSSLIQIWVHQTTISLITLCRHNSIVERLNFYLIACRRCRCRCLVCHIIIILSLLPSHFPIHFCVPSRELAK